jgi:hypothetical protein
MPAVHVKPEAQSVVDAQCEAHAPFVQPYGEHGMT